ncbi:HU family DNA-binding protein [Parabacteroides sp. APC149_11_2_Y6]
MNKIGLAKRISERTSLPYKDVLDFIDILNDEIIEIFKEDERLVLKGFGAFHVWKQTERVGRNPKTGTACTIPPRSSIKFKPGKKLLEGLNK